MRQPLSLLFDLDGTLVDSARHIASALSQLSVGRGGGDIAVEKVRSLVSLGANALVQTALGNLVHDSQGDLAAFREQLAAIEPDVDAVYPGVPGALQALTEDGYAMAVVTNKPERLSRTLLDQMGLLRFFDVVVGGDTLRQCKPDPAPLQHARQLLGMATDQAVLIGDSRIDAAAAHAAGARFVLFQGGYDSAGCNPGHIAARFPHFDALHDVVQKITVETTNLFSTNALE